MTGKALKLFLIVISIIYLGLASYTPLFAQDQAPPDITYGEPEETDFC